MKKLECWKKVFESDLGHILEEVKNLVKGPAVIILSGQVGAGKTTLCKKFIELMNTQKVVDEMSSEEDVPADHLQRELYLEGADYVQSPTYSLVQEVGRVAHADFYRLNSVDDVIHLELSLYLDEKDYFLVEWGAPYLKELQRQIHQEFKYYEITIETVNASSAPNTCHMSSELLASKTNSRNICLYELS